MKLKKTVYNPPLTAESNPVPSMSRGLEPIWYYHGDEKEKNFCIPGLYGVPKGWICIAHVVIPKTNLIDDALVLLCPRSGDYAIGVWEVEPSLYPITIAAYVPVETNPSLREKERVKIPLIDVEVLEVR